jgi:hypothetical protein
VRPRANGSVAQSRCAVIFARRTRRASRRLEPSAAQCAYTPAASLLPGFFSCERVVCWRGKSDNGPHDNRHEEIKLNRSREGEGFICVEVKLPRSLSVSIGTDQLVS